MSPSENQLRAALRDGEGGRPDPDQIIQAAVTIRRERRQTQRRLAGAVAGIVIVGGIGIGLATTRGGNDSTHSAANGAGGNLSGLAPATTVPSGTAGSGGFAAGTEVRPATSGLGATTNDGLSSTSTSGCPAKPVEYLLPGGGGSGQFDQNAPLFAKPVRTVKLCSYSPETGAFVGAINLTGDRAQQFVDSLTTSKDGATSLDCLSPIKMEILATDTAGAALTPLSVVGTCRQVAVTNGTALRYAKITDLTAVGVPATVVPSPSGIESGSPPR
jgi:hypothetical protein